MIYNFESSEFGISSIKNKNAGRNLKILSLALYPVFHVYPGFYIIYNIFSLNNIFRARLVGEKIGFSR